MLVAGEVRPDVGHGRPRRVACGAGEPTGWDIIVITNGSTLTKMIQLGYLEELPADLRLNALQLPGGSRWLQQFNNLCAAVLESWQLEADPAGGGPWFGQLAAVVPVRTRSGTPAVLKLAVPHDEALLESARREPERPMLVFYGRSISYAEGLAQVVRQRLLELPLRVVGKKCLGVGAKDLEGVPGCDLRGNRPPSSLHARWASQNRFRYCRRDRKWRC